MKQLVVKEDFAFLYVNSSIYSQSSIEITLKAFKDFIQPSLTILGNYTIIKYEILNQEYSLEELGYEILNYMIGIAKQEEVMNNVN